MHTPHDAFFRRVFGQPRRLAGLLESILPRSAARELAWPALELVPPRRTTRALRGHESDLVARIPFRDSRSGGRPPRQRLEVQVVVEHQSSSPLVMALRHAAYATQQMLDAARAGGGRGPVPPVLCVVIHTGAGPWNAPCRLHALLPALQRLPALAPFVPDVELLVDDLSAVPRASIDARPLDVVGQVALGAFVDVRCDRPLETLVRDLARLKDAEPPGDPSSAEVLLEYYAYTAEHLAVDDLLSLPERLVAKEKSMTVAQVLMQRGRAEGEARGRAEGARRVLANLLVLRFGALDADLARRLDSADEAALLRAAERVLGAASAAEVFDEA
jgi:hypothetical protein